MHMPMHVNFLKHSLKFLCVDLRSFFLSIIGTLLCYFTVILYVCIKHFLVVYSRVVVRKWDARSIRVCVTEPEVDGDE